MRIHDFGFLGDIHESMILSNWVDAGWWIWKYDTLCDCWLGVQMPTIEE
jgi:hypothetical protein